MEELLSLKWNNHRSTFLHILTVLRDKQLYTDVTLACEGRFYSVHKLVLSTCSDYFSAIFDRTTCKNPTIVLKDIKCEDLEALLDYMYLGEVNVRQADLASLIKAAECLRVKGLAVPDDEPPKKGSHSDSSVRKHDGTNSPPSKRKRRSEEQDGRDDVRLNSSRRSRSPHSHSRLSPTPKDPLSDGTRPSSPSQQSDSANLSSQNDVPFVKVEMEDKDGIEIDDSYNLPNDSYKEEQPENDDPGDLSNDLPEFLQDNMSQQGSSNFSHGAFPGTSYQPGDLSGWQGEGSNSNFPSHLNYGSSDSSQNTPGDAVLYAGMMSPEVTCQHCQKQFAGPNRQYVLNRHLATVHASHKAYRCPLCQYKTARKDHITAHIKVVHASFLMECGFMQGSLMNS